MKKPFIIILSLGFAATLVVSFLFAIDAKAVQVYQTAPSVLYVAVDGNCGEASPCYETVQAAVNAAVAGDEIRVAAGTYQGVTEQGGQPQSIYVDKDLTIRGGYTTDNWNAPEPQANLTEIDANALGRVLKIMGDVEILVDGIRFRNGNAAGLTGLTRYPETDAGGGIYIREAMVTLSRVDILSNTVSDGYGGGIYQDGGMLTITESTIQGNYAGIGGGILSIEAALTVQDSAFLGNSVAAYGGASAMYVANGMSVDLNGNFIANNDSNYAGTMALENSFDVIIRENTITNNSSGGIELWGVTNGLIFSNTISQNSGYSTISSSGSNIRIEANSVISNEIEYGGAIRARGEIEIIGNTIMDNVSNQGPGGGVSIYGPEAEPVIRGNIIQGNRQMNGNGGGIYAEDCNDLLITDNLIIGNQATSGYYTAAGIMDVGILDGGIGGGVFLYHSDPVMRNNIIANNQADRYGSGIYAAGSSPRIYHTTITGNTGGDGQGVAAGNIENDPSVIQLHNSIIANQTTGVWTDPANNLNSVTVNGVLWDSNIENTSGNVTNLSEVSGAAAFVDPANYDYHLSDTSAAIDQGLETSVLTDIDGEPRLRPPDLGADEYWVVGELQQILMPILWANSQE